MAGSDHEGDGGWPHRFDNFAEEWRKKRKLAKIPSRLNRGEGDRSLAGM